MTDAELVCRAMGIAKIYVSSPSYVNGYPTGSTLAEALKVACERPFPVIFGTECSPKGHSTKDGYMRPIWKAWIKSYYADARRIDVETYADTELDARIAACKAAFCGEGE